MVANALLICGFDPDKHSTISLNAKEVPQEFFEAKRLNRIFSKTDFGNRYSFSGVSPLMYINECLRKDIPMPDELLASAKKLHEHTKKFKSSNEEVAESQRPRERDNLLKLLGSFVFIYLSKGETVSIKPQDKVTVSRITENIMQYLSDHEVTMTGLGKSNINKKISEGVQLFRDSID